MTKSEENSSSKTKSYFKEIDVSKISFHFNHFQPNTLLFRNPSTTDLVNNLTCFSILINAFYSVSPFFLTSFFQNGFIQGILYIIFMAMIAFLSYSIFLRICFFSIETKYSNICRLLFGSISVPLILLLLYFSFLTITQTAMNDSAVILQSLIDRFYPNAPYILKNRWFPSFFLTLIATIICSFGKKHRTIKYFAIIGNILSIMIIIFLIYYIFHPISTYYQDQKLILFSSKDFFTPDLLIISFTIFYIHPFLHPIFLYHMKPTIKTTFLTISISLSIGVILDIFTAIAGFFTLPAMETRTNMFLCNR